MHEVIVIGGGIAGLTAAYLIKESNPGIDLLLLEEKPQIGGNIRTLVDNGNRMETGPHSFMGSSEHTWMLVERLGIDNQVEPASPASRNRYIYRKNRLKPLPMGPGQFVASTLLSPAAKLRLMAEPIVPGGADEHETAWEFFCRRFGKEAATYIMSPFISGVYAGDVHQLGARAAFRKFWQFEKDKGSMIRGAFTYMRDKRRRLKRQGKPMRRGLFSFATGLGCITHSLGLNVTSERIETGVAVEGIRRRRGGYTVAAGDRQWQSASVVVAVPPPGAAGILADLDSDLDMLLRDIPMAPVTMVHWRVRDPKRAYPEGFGFLMPRVQDLKVLGTLFPSSLFSDRVEPGWRLFASFYGGMTDPDAASIDDDRLTGILLEEHRRIFRQELMDAEVLKILRYPTAIPQMLPDHPERIERTKRRVESDHPGLFLAGNYLSGVGIEHAVESGFHAARKFKKYFSRNRGGQRSHDG